MKGVIIITPMKDCIQIKEICEEYCEEISVKSLNEITVLVEAKYFDDLVKRLSCHGWHKRSKKRKHFLILATFFNPIL